jgi:hypothetical protein
MDKILGGHTSFETAFIQDDYPYGQTLLRCQRAVWVETATKGKCNNDMRFCYRMTNPRQNDRWNNRQAELYYPFVMMYINDTTEGAINQIKRIELRWKTSAKELDDFKAKWMNQIQEQPYILKRFEMYEKWWQYIQERVINSARLQGIDEATALYSFSNL